MAMAPPPLPIRGLRRCSPRSRQRYMLQSAARCAASKAKSAWWIWTVSTLGIWALFVPFPPSPEEAVRHALLEYDIQEGREPFLREAEAEVEALLAGSAP